MVSEQKVGYFVLRSVFRGTLRTKSGVCFGLGGWQFNSVAAVDRDGV